MQRSDTTALLTRIVAFDRREADALTVEAWHDIIGHLDYAPAYQAVLTHYRASGAYPIRPGDVIERVAKQQDAAHRAAVEALRETHRAELSAYLDAPAEAFVTLRARMFEFEGTPEDVERARAVLRRQDRERMALEDRHASTVAALQLESPNDHIAPQNEWKYR